MGNTRRRSITRIVAYTIGLTVITAAIVFGAFLAYCLYSPDFDVAIVRGPSMEPTIKVGSLAFVRNNPENIGIDDIIAFDIGKESQVIHRISSISDGVIKTKGDNLEQEDYWQINRGDITAEYLFSIPYLGYISSFIGTRLGIITCILVPGFLISVYIIYLIIKEIRSKKEWKLYNPKMY